MGTFKKSFLLLGTSLLPPYILLIQFFLNDEEAGIYAVSILALAALTSLLLILLSVRVVHAHLNRAIKIARQLVQGDLTVIPTNSSNVVIDHLFTALADINIQLFKVVSEVRGGTTSVAAAARDMLSEATALSGRTNTQVVALQQTSSLLSELTAASVKSSNSAVEADKYVTLASTSVNDGMSLLQDVVIKMAEIRDRANSVGEIIELINSIAFQTNILALNAAVEAARAGEQGKGFAVVAVEVRSLAQRAAAAAQTIKGLIEASGQAIDVGEQLAGAANKRVSEATEKIKNVSALISEISADGQRQRNDIQEIGEAVSAIQKVTQQNSVQVANSSGASSNLMRKAERLILAISNYHLGEKEFGSAEEAMQMVKNAILFMQRHGKASLFEEINAGAPDFLDRDLYLLVIDTIDSKILANSYAPHRVGIETAGIQDNKGKFFARDLMREVLANGHAWVEYNFVHPITGEVLPKSSYGEFSDGLLFSCGFFKR